MKNITHDSPLIIKYLAWADDRFPLPNVISGALSFYVMISIGRFLAGNAGLSLTGLDFLGMFAYTGHLLLLRIFDEHKDYAVDKINHPERVLSQGIITLKHLKSLAIPMPILAITWSLLIDNGPGNALMIWSLMFGYTIFMTLEFFIGNWLRKRLFLYSFSHMLVSPLMILWPIVGGMQKIELPLLVSLILILAVTSGLSYEFTRKTRGNDEDKALDAYNKSFGTKGSIFLISILNFISLVLAYKSLQLLNGNSIAAIVILLLGYSCTFYPTYNFLKKCTEKARKVNEGGVGLYFLGLYISILVALA